MRKTQLAARSLAEYLARPVARRAQLREVIQLIRSSLPETVVFGGMIRDFAQGRARTFVSDIDLVSLESDDRILEVIGRFSPKRNRFGGFRFHSGKWRFDLWSLSRTWAFREGGLSGNNLSDLLETTFLNVDAAIFHLDSCTLSTSREFDLGIENRVLDLNFERNPAPQRMAEKALRMAIERDFALTARLVRYITHNLTSRPLWIGEAVWHQMLRHTETKDEILEIRIQKDLAIRW